MMPVLGAGLCALVAILLLRELRRDFVPLVLLAFTAVFLLALFDRLGEAFAFLKECAAAAGGERLAPVLKALGITYLTSLAGELCRSAGEGGLGNLMELLGKAEILLLCVPLFRSVLDMAFQLG